LQVIHGAMLAGMALLAAIATWLIISRGALGQADASFGKTLQVVVVLAAIGATAAGFTVFKKRIQAIGPLETVQNKIAAYRAAAIIRWALVEFPTLLSLIAFLLTGNYAFLALGIALMLLFAVLRPAKLMIVYLLKLTEKEVSELEGGASE